MSGILAAATLGRNRPVLSNAFYRGVACSVIEAVYESDNDARAILQVEPSAKIPGKFA